MAEEYALAQQASAADAQPRRARPRAGSFSLAARRSIHERSWQMQIRTRMCMSADGYVTTPDG
jgi:hypothetical protein